MSAVSTTFREHRGRERGANRVDMRRLVTASIDRMRVGILAIILAGHSITGVTPRS